MDFSDTLTGKVLFRGDIKSLQKMALLRISLAFLAVCILQIKGEEMFSLDAFVDNLAYEISLLQSNPSWIKQGMERAGRQFFGGQPGGGFGGDQDEDEDSGEEGTTLPGPGALGILTGIFGIFTGIGSANPNRVLQSTVNFFPPDQRQKAQAQLNQLLGKTTPKPVQPVRNATASNETTARAPPQPTQPPTTLKATQRTAKPTQKPEDEEEEDRRLRSPLSTRKPAPKPVRRPTTQRSRVSTPDDDEFNNYEAAA